MCDYTDECQCSRCQRAYAEGAETAENESLFDAFFHAIGDAVGTVVPASKEWQSREAGYHGKK